MIGYQKKINLPDGSEITIETGKLAKQANGSVVVRQGNCMLLATVVTTKEAKEDVDFLPLSVDYQEKFASNGRIPGGFFKREGRLSDYEILISRLIDRALRPLFPEDFHADTQVMVTMISADENIAPDSLAALAASAALAVSDIPFNGPISEVRVGRLNGNFVVNPPLQELDNLDIDLIVAADPKNVLMVEGECRECSEEDLIVAIQKAHEYIKIQCQAQIELAAECGKAKYTYEHEKKDEVLKAEIWAYAFDKVKDIARQALPKKDRGAAFKEVREAFLATKTEEEVAALSNFLLKKYFHDVEKDAIRELLLDENIRLDGRKPDQIRPIWSEVGYLPTAHGSAVFTRGETQSITTVTLGSKMDEQEVDGAIFQNSKNFILHYNFPGFSTGEVRPNRGPGRREVGHGNLAMRSLKHVLPASSENPYTIRIVSDILESNGSSSMATVCAGTLALMDAGVKISNPVSGIAMGLITDGNRFGILSDILGDEDHLGDMDFKVTGTEKGICAVQMDLKIDGLPHEIMVKALHQAKAGRMHILEKLSETIAQPNSDYKPHAPRIVEIVIDKEFIGAVIGPGGKIIQEMQRETNTTISIEEKNGAGYVQIFAKNQADLEAAKSRVNAITAKPEVGGTYKGKVKGIQTFGAFLEIMPGKEGLLHISEISYERLPSMDGVLKEGDEIEVKLLEIENGKLRLSRKALLEKPEGYVEPERRKPDGDRNRVGGDRNRGGGDRRPNNDRR